MEQGVLWRAWGTAVGVPLFEEYLLYPDRLVVRRGILVRREDEMLAHRIMDTTLEVSLLERMLGLGTVVVRTLDPTDPVLRLRGIRNARRVRDLIRKVVGEARSRLGVSGREMWGAAREAADYGEWHDGVGAGGTA